MDTIEDCRTFLRKAVEGGNRLFRAPPPEEAFEVWWRNEFGKSGLKHKPYARKAWYAAMTEMNVFAKETSLDS